MATDDPRQSLGLAIQHALKTRTAVLVDRGVHLGLSEFDLADVALTWFSAQQSATPTTEPTNWPAMARLYLAAADGDEGALQRMRDIAAGATEPAQPEHQVTVEWKTNGGVSYAFRCNAPEQSLCHAVYECHCEEWMDAGVTFDGLPYHDVDSGDPDDHGEQPIRHYGRLVPDECNERDWFENSDEVLRGKVTFPVIGEYSDGMGMTFTVVQP